MFQMATKPKADTKKEENSFLFTIFFDEKQC